MACRPMMPASGADHHVDHVADNHRPPGELEAYAVFADNSYASSFVDQLHGLYRFRIILRFYACPRPLLRLWRSCRI